MKNYYYKGKNVGILKDNKEYLTYRNIKHFFIKYNGFGISTTILRELKDKGCERITVIYDSGATQKLYHAHPNIFYKYGTRYEHGEDI